MDKRILIGFCTVLFLACTNPSEQSNNSENQEQLERISNIESEVDALNKETEELNKQLDSLLNTL